MKILFVCTGNYYRSRFAEIYFNFKCLKSNYQSYSKGLDISNPDNIGLLSPFTTKYLSSCNIPVPINLKAPALLVQSDFENFDIIIALNKSEHFDVIQDKFPHELQNVIFWNISDVYEESYELALSKLNLKLDKFINSLI